jgi:prepilin-type processing-associated H-X9-DG protein
MRCCLIVQNGPLAGREIELAGDEILLGRGAETELRFEGADVSRLHARILRDENYFWLEDANSVAGTFVNDRRIRRHCLQSGDVIRIGVHRLRFEASGTGTERRMDEALERESAALAGEGEEPEAPARRPLNVLAVAAGVLALLGLPVVAARFAFWPFGLAACVLGLIAVVQIRRGRPERGARLAWAALVLGLVLGAVGLYAGVIGPGRREAAERDADAGCRERLERLAGALRRYALLHNERYPETLADLQPEHVSSDDLLRCPVCAHHEAGAAACLYSFPAAGKQAAPRRDLILLHCPAPHRRGGNVLYGDGRVEWLPLDEFTALTGLPAPAGPPRKGPAP